MFITVSADTTSTTACPSDVYANSNYGSGYIVYTNHPHDTATTSCPPQNYKQFGPYANLQNIYNESLDVEDEVIDYDAPKVGWVPLIVKISPCKERPLGYKESPVAECYWQRGPPVIKFHY